MGSNMRTSLRESSSGDQGFTLIELLVVILIIGILAAIAIPSFLSQKSKAYDAGAKELVRTARTAMETYSTDHDGKYAVSGTPPTIAELHAYDASIPESQADAKGGAYLKEAPKLPNGNEEEFTVTAVAANTGDEFTIERNKNGEVTRTCSSTKNGCAGSSTSEW
jgi:type IV pilus assembly protein PilA